MAKQVQVYSFAEVAVFIDNLAVDNFWEGDDVVNIEYNTDVSNLIIGADGTGLLNVSQDNSATITLRLKTSSAAHKYLKNKVTLARSGRLRPFRMSVTDTITGEAGNGENCFVGPQPARTYGNNASVAEWQILCPEWIETEVNT